MTARAATGGTRVKAKAATQKMTPAQYRQFLRYVRSHPKPTTKKKSAGKRKTARRGAPCDAPMQPGYWLAGDNDVDQSCVPVALANVILAQTGHRASLADIRSMHATNTRESQWGSIHRRVPRWPRSRHNSK